MKTVSDLILVNNYLNEDERVKKKKSLKHH